MLYRLAFKSFKKQVRSYLIYFLSMVLAVAIFYCFSALTYDQEIVLRANQDLRLSQLLNVGQFLVFGILLFFMLSANRFFLVRRSEEIGIYLMYGLKKIKITFLFIAETLLLGILSLVAGIVVGMLVSKLFSMILIRAMALNIASTFFVSWQSIGIATMAMLTVLVVVCIRTTWILYRSNLYLLYREQELDSQKLQIRFYEKILGGLSLVFLFSCYFTAVATNEFAQWLSNYTGGLLGYFLAAFITFILGLFGTISFFLWGMKWLLWLFSKSKKIANRNLNALLLGNLRARVLHSRKTAAIIAVTISIGVLLIGLSFATFLLSLRTVYYSDPVSFQVAQENYPQLVETIQENDGEITEEETLHFKTTGNYLSLSIAGEPTENQVGIISLISLSNYRDYRKLNDQLPAIDLNNAEDAILLDSLQNTFQHIITYGSKTYIPDHQLNIVATIPDHLGYSISRHAELTLVIQDKVFEQTPGYEYAIAVFNSKVENQEALANAIHRDLPTEWIDPVTYNYQWNGEELIGNIGAGTNGADSRLRLNLSSQYLTWRSSRRQTGVVIYVSIFIGLISLITTASILSLRQLAEAARDKKNYRLLFILGVPKKKILQLIYRENALIFFPIMGLGMLNSFFGIYLLSQYISYTSFWLPNIFVVFLAVVYLVFYFLTVIFYRRSVGL